MASIPEFYAGKSVFITGATGFMGKVLVEKLLRACVHIHTIYILIRSKPKEDIMDRLFKLLSDPAFSRVRDPALLKKVVPIRGDVSCSGLGITSLDLQRLIENVSVVFHCAASVRFDEPLRQAVDVNVLGTERVIQLCTRLKHLEAFIHVSTAYSNCGRRDISEQVYPMPYHVDKVTQLMGWLDDGAIGALTPHLLSQWPNTYTYTKALAEDLVDDRCRNLPAAIFRPSIVVCAWEEPFPGWVDNMNGPTGLGVGCMLGVIRSLHTDGDITTDYIPVDLTINAIIALGWYISKNRFNGTPVFHCTSGGINTLTANDFLVHGLNAVYESPSISTLWYPSLVLRSSAWVYNLESFFYLYLPALFADIVLYIAKRKTRYVRLYTKIKNGLSVLSYFMHNEWNFASANLRSVLDSMSPQDKEDFNFDVRTIDWPRCMVNYHLGAKKYLLREGPHDVPRALKKLTWLYRLRIALGLTSATVFCFMLTPWIATSVCALCGGSFA